MSTIDRRGATVSAADPPISTNPNPDLAWKAPVRVATTANINLQTIGLGTIDGVALAAGDRVLVKNQSDQTTNGLYNASTGPWTRTIDAANNSQFTQGLCVLVTQGAVNAGAIYEFTAANPITVGTTNLTFASLGLPAVPATRAINTTAPLAGGGNLGSDLTLSITIGGTLAVVGNALQTIAGTGDVTWSANSFATTIAAAAVTYAKMQNVAASRLLGNPTGGATSPSEISLGATLAFSAAALQTTAMTGDMTTSANSFATSAAANILKRDATNTISKGYTLTPNNIGTVSSGTTTPDPTLGNYQFLTNNGAFTLANPSSDCAIDILITNGASAGTITFSTFTVGTTGDALTTTNGNKFIVSIRRINSVSTYIVKALQ
jgi:hypothetical protein